MGEDVMWYAVQMKSGEEERIGKLLETDPRKPFQGKIVLPLYEEVRRSRGMCRILFRRLFPGYFFVETEAPGELSDALRRVPDFTRLLGREVGAGDPFFIPIRPEEEAFLKTILDDGVMHVSYVRMSAGNRRIEKIVGPLAGYSNHITKLEIRNREAVVDTEIFGRRQHIRFGLWLDGDPRLPWLEAQKMLEQAPALDVGAEIDIGLKPGDRVMDENGVYGDQVFTVDSVDVKHRTIMTTMQMGGSFARVRMYADSVRKV